MVVGQEGGRPEGEAAAGQVHANVACHDPLVVHLVGVAVQQDCTGTTFSNITFIRTQMCELVNLPELTLLGSMLGPAHPVHGRDLELERVRNADRNIRNNLRLLYIKLYYFWSAKVAKSAIILLLY